MTAAVTDRHRAITDVPGSLEVGGREPGPAPDPGNSMVRTVVREVLAESGKGGGPVDRFARLLAILALGIAVGYPGVHEAIAGGEYRRAQARQAEGIAMLAELLMRHIEYTERDLSERNPSLGPPPTSDRDFYRVLEKLR